MSVEAIVWAYAQPLPPLPKFALITIADEVNEYNEWPLDVERLVSRTGMSRVEVIESIAHCINSGYVAKALVEDYGGRRVEGLVIAAPDSEWRRSR